MGVFISQSPAEGDVLFETVPGFMENLQVIAQHMAQPALTGQRSGPMTFAIYGQWGAGKSTALRRLEALVRDLAEDGGGVVTSSYYAAPLWQSTPNAQHTLAYTILREINPGAIFSAFSGGERPALTGSEDEVTRFARLAEVFRDSPALHQQWMVHISRALDPDGQPGAAAAPASSLPAPVVPGGSARGRARPHGGRGWWGGGPAGAADAPGPAEPADLVPAAGQPRGGSPVHIVFIDDVDRCGRRFTAELLAATTFWDTPGQKNIFFVVAASEQHLLDSLSEHLPLGTHTPRQALEKYVHLGVSVPEMLTRPADVARYLVELCASVDSSMVTAEQLDELRELIRDSERDYPDCPLAPLLQTAAGMTPRAVKHRFNTFLAEFRPPHGALDPVAVKQWVIKAFWPDFWWRYLWPIGRAEEFGHEENRAIDYLVELTEYGRKLLPLWGLGDAELRPALRYLAQNDGLELRDVEPELVIYLAARPPWQPPPRGGPYHSLQAAGALGGHRAEESDVDLANLGTQVARDAPENLVMLEQIMAENALGQGDLGEAAGHLRNIVHFVRQGLPAVAAPVVGNAALVAERMGLVPVARELHLAAHELDPAHANIIQNLVEFVIDNRQDDLYPTATQLLSRLSVAPDAHKPARTLALRAQLGELTGEPLEVRRANVERLLGLLEDNPTEEVLAQLFRVGTGLVDMATIRRACQRVTENAPDDAARYVLLRLYADFLARSDDRPDELEAVDLYRFLLSSGLACLPGAGDGAAMEVWHNLAALLGAIGQRQQAAVIWRWMYGTWPMDQRSRRAFAITLDALNLNSAAAAVLLGQALPEIELDAAPLPARMSDRDHWWEALPSSDYPPCLGPAGPGDGGGSEQGVYGPAAIVLGGGQPPVGTGADGAGPVLPR